MSQERNYQDNRSQEEFNDVEQIYAEPTNPSSAADDIVPDRDGSGSNSMLSKLTSTTATIAMMAVGVGLGFGVVIGASIGGTVEHNQQQNAAMAAITKAPKARRGKARRTPQPITKAPKFPKARRTPQPTGVTGCTPSPTTSSPTRATPAPTKASLLPSTTFGYLSTDTTSSCFTTGVLPLIDSNNYAACSRYWYNGPGLGEGQNSTCAGTSAYLADPSGNIPSNGNPANNTCLGVGDSPSCFVLEGVNNDEPVLVRTSVAWDWSEYAIPFQSPNSTTCGTIGTLESAPSTVNTCASILTDSSIPVVAADDTTGGAPGGGVTGTTGQCYSIDPINKDIVPVTPGVSTITSTVTFTIDSNDYVCQVTVGGQVCEMWGFTNGYGNNFDSQYIPFRCDDIEGDAYEGYIAYVFDQYLLTPVFYGAGQAPQIVLRKV